MADSSGVPFAAIEQVREAIGYVGEPVPGSVRLGFASLAAIQELAEALGCYFEDEGWVLDDLLQVAHDAEFAEEFARNNGEALLNVVVALARVRAGAREEGAADG